MGPGRPKTPARLKLITNNPGKRPIQKEPRPTAELEKPAHIVGNIAAEWDRVVASMPPGFFTAADAPVLTVYCEALVLRRNAMTIFQAEADKGGGLVVKGSAGQAAAHPMIAVASRQADIILKCASQLGMSPAARARLTAPDDEDSDEIDRRYFGG